jgi:catalase
MTKITTPSLVCFRLMNPEQQQVLFENTTHALDDAPMEVKIGHIGNCLKADKAYGKGVADALSIKLNSVPK